MTRPNEDDLFVDRLFPVSSPGREPIRVKRPQIPVWTENKAILIQRYLRLFLFITKHGSYLDGFAGPQDDANPRSWAANLVLELQPEWMRHFYLFDSCPGQVEKLEALRDEYSDRDVRVFDGDFNLKVGQVLRPEVIGEREATFCLLDQRTFECDWATVASLSSFKRSGLKIELFYFLAEGWLNRALAALGQAGEARVAEKWWARGDFAEFKALAGPSRAEFVSQRIQDELGYLSAKAWPIFERDGARGRTMYYMIHATDHPEAPDLMSRAYRQTVRQGPVHEQLGFELG